MAKRLNDFTPNPIIYPEIPQTFSLLVPFFGLSRFAFFHTQNCVEAASFAAMHLPMVLCALRVGQRQSHVFRAWGYTPRA